MNTKIQLFGTSLLLLFPVFGFAQTNDDPDAGPSLPAASTGVNMDARELMNLSQLIELENKKADLARAEARRVSAQLAAKSGGTQVAESNDIPSLVGIKGKGRALTAEFLVNSALLKADPGDWVTPNWRLERVLSNGVELVKKDGKARHTILFGHAPISSNPDALSGPLRTTPPNIAGSPSFNQTGY